MVGTKEVKRYSDYCHQRLQEAEPGSGDMRYWQGRWHVGMGYVTELDFIDFAELKSVAPETIEYLEASYTGARMADDVVAMQAFANAIAALRCIEVLPDDSIDRYKTNN